MNVKLIKNNNIPDLRRIGSNISTGYKAKLDNFRSVNVYMTNTGNSFWLYIKRKGHNVPLQNLNPVFNSESLHTNLNRNDFYIKEELS